MRIHGDYKNRQVVSAASLCDLPISDSGQQPVAYNKASFPEQTQKVSEVNVRCQ